jgi:uncharacterized protein (TIGR03067 family)
MKRIAVILVAAGIAFGSTLVAQEKPAADKGVPALQGVWSVLSINGQSSADAGMTMTLTITGENYVQALNGNVNERGTIKVDQSKKPMTIDFNIMEGDDTGKPQVGLVDVAGDTMTMKLGQPGSTTRPSGMAAEEGFFLVTAKKSK